MSIILKEQEQQVTTWDIPQGPESRLNNVINKLIKDTI
jgi:hypothetical protein